MGVFSLAGWSRRIRAGFLVSRVTQDTATSRHASRKGLSPAMARLSSRFRSRWGYDSAVLLPRRRRNADGLGSSPVARHYWGNHCCFLLLGVLRCFSSPRSPPQEMRMTVLQTDGLSHSEIRGSTVICTFPRLIAAYHVLHRLHEPRHPPCALSCFFLLFSHCRSDLHGRSYFQLCLTPPETEPPAGEFCFFLLALLVPKCQRSSS